MSATKAGAWYYGHRCEKCNAPIATVEDPDKGTGPAITFPPAVNELRCERCAHVASYNASNAGRFQAPPSVGS